MGVRRMASIRSVLAVISWMTLVGCDGSPGTQLYSFTPEAAGDPCKYGGIEILTGYDGNENGTLDSAEVDASKTQYACAVLAEGKIAKIKVTTITPGATCTAGGIRIESGLDSNDNKILDSAEVDSTATVCNGTNGTNGTNGVDGDLSLIRLSDVPSGSEQCLFGGTRIDSGVDDDSDGILENQEVDSTQYVCSVRVIQNVIVESAILLPGQDPACPEGGVKMISGVDQDGDRILQAGEITASVNICNTITTVPGKNSLIRTWPATVVQCPYGGSVITSGVDQNSSGVLDTNEVTATSLICNGGDGFNSLVNSTSEPAGSHCTTGGKKFQTGLDVNRDNVLQTSEVQATSYVCNGMTGAAGENGHSSLIKQTADSTMCDYGGVKIETGVDDNDDGNLQNFEISYTSYVCHGYDGYAALVEAYDDFVYCATGGIRIEMGLDYDNDSYLDFGEVTYTKYLCNGSDGWIIDTTDSLDYGSCPAGGVKILAGPDLNGDGYLTGMEVQQTTYVCDGVDGY